MNVTCAIIRAADKVLVCQRSERMSHPLKWEFPGGKQQENESPEECIARELMEELNIEVRIVERLADCPHDYGHVSINLIPFIVDYVEGTLELKEHKNAQWLAPAALRALDWAEADIAVVEAFLKKC